MAILGMVNWIHKWYDEKGEMSIDQIADIFNDFILRGLLADELLEVSEYKSLLIKPFYFMRKMT